jgi:bifunctional non-homologous end joining protein LigD
MTVRPLPTLAPLPLQRRRDPFDNRDWLFELKLDGFRGLAYIERGTCRLVSRNGIIFKRFAPLAAEIAVALAGVKNAILDGEVVRLDDDGRPLFNALLYRRGAPCFVAFDCLWLDGRDLRRLPLIERKRVLREIVPRRSVSVQYLSHVARRGMDLFTEVVQRDLEGVVAKLRQAPYDLVDGRSPWVKIKNREYTQAVGRHEQFDGFGATSESLAGVKPG